MARILPDFVGIVIFALISGLLFAVIPFSNEGGYLLLFIAVMMVIVLIRLITLLSRLIWSHHAAQLRLIPVSDATSALLHQNFIRLAGYFAGVYVLMLFLQKLEAPMDGIFLITLVISIPFMGMMGRILWQSRTMVAAHLRQMNQRPSGDISWFWNQLAASWHILAMGYVAILGDSQQRIYHQTAAIGSIRMSHFGNSGLRFKRFSIALITVLLSITPFS